jgi:centrosomal protein POC5
LSCQHRTRTIVDEFDRDNALRCHELETKVRHANDEIARLRHVDTIDHDDTIRKAFMRGVCALNMEAMNVLLKDESELDGTLLIHNEHRQCKNRK